MGELVDAGFAPDELAILHQHLAVGLRELGLPERDLGIPLGDQAIALGDLGQQPLRQRAQLGLAESLELFAGEHERQCAELRGKGHSQTPQLLQGHLPLTPW